MLNHSEIMGRLTADPELRYTQSGTAVTSFTLANDTGRKRNDGSRITNFIDCVAWRNQAEFAAKYLTKGRLIVVEGEMTPRTYDDKNGVRHKVTELNVDKIHFADTTTQHPKRRLDPRRTASRRSEVTRISRFNSKASAGRPQDVHGPKEGARAWHG